MFLFSTSIFRGLLDSLSTFYIFVVAVVILGIILLAALKIAEGWIELQAKKGVIVFHILIF